MGMGVIWVLANWKLREIGRVGPCDALTAYGLAKLYRAEFMVGFVGNRPVEFQKIDYI